MSETVRRIRPTPLPIEVYLDNPHRGLCTFQKFNGDPLFEDCRNTDSMGPLEFPEATARVAPGYLPTTVAYCRWFWEVMEPRPGEYDFSMIDRALQTCAQRGQSLAVRLMAYGWMHQRQAPAWYAERAPMEKRQVKSATWMTPVHDAPQYLHHWGGLVREFARRYDGHPLLESNDMAYIGPWGEGDGACGLDQCQRFVDLWRESFACTPRLALIGGDQMRLGIASGSGWRCDCFGDLSADGSPHVRRDQSWNHMYDFYPAAVIEAGAADTWKTVPVHLETCWVPRDWAERGFDVDFILEQGLKYHASYWMPKSTPLPPQWMDKFIRFTNRLGYRYICRQAVLDARVTSGGAMTFRAWIENVGVAPIYRRYDLAVRFRQQDRERIVVLDDQDVRTWLPGDACINRPVQIPSDLGRGWTEFALGLVDPADRKPRISFANKEAFSDRWLDLGGLELT